MPRRNRSDKSCMTRIPSDDKGLDAMLEVPSTRYKLLATGNFASSSKILRVATPNLKQHTSSHTSAENVMPEDAQFFADDSLMQLDPAYLERLNEAFVTVKQPRSYVSTLNFLSLISFEHAPSSSTLLKDGSRNAIHFWLSCCDGKVGVITSQRHAHSVGVPKVSVIIASIVWVLDSYAETALYFSTNATHFTMLRCVSVLIITTALILR
jgi:hypothetical protein